MSRQFWSATSPLIGFALSFSLSACQGTGSQPLSPASAPPTRASAAPLPQASPSSAAPSPAVSPLDSPSPQSLSPAITPDPGSTPATPVAPAASASPAVLPAGLSQIRFAAVDRQLTAIGDSRQLRVELLDAQGRVLEAPLPAFEWLNSRPQDLSVSAGGEVRALVDLGYSEVSARIPGTDLSTRVLINIFDSQSYGGSSGSGGGSGGSRASASPDPYRLHPIGEFQVNTYVGTRLQQNDVAMDEAGRFAVVWRDRTRRGAYGRCFEADGDARGDEFLIGDASVDGSIPEVSMDDAGNFVVVWSHTDANGDEGVWGRRYARGCRPRDESAFAINTTTTGVQYRPSVALDGDGDFVVVWESERTILGRRFSEDGPEGRSEFQVSLPDDAIDDTRPNVVMDEAGDFVVVWEDYAPGDGSGAGISARRYDRRGNPLASIRVNTHTNAQQIKSDVAMDSDGNFIVAWTNYSDQDVPDTSRGGVYARRFERDGDPIDASEFLVNVYTTGYQWVPTVGLDDDGDFVIAWSSDRDGGTTSSSGPYGGEFYSIYARQYHADGSPASDEFQVNTVNTTGKQAKPEMAMNSAGHFIITWWSQHNGTNAQIMAGNGLDP